MPLIYNLKAEKNPTPKMVISKAWDFQIFSCDKVSQGNLCAEQLTCCASMTELMERCLGTMLIEKG